MMKRKLPTASVLGVATAAVCFATTADALPTPVTHQTVLVEEFTATWCYYCQFAYDLLEREKVKWGDAISILSYNISDSLSTSYTERRGSEWGVTAIPTFVFHSKYKVLGTPSDNSFDNYIGLCQDISQHLEMLANYSVDTNQRKIKINLKVRSGVSFKPGDQIRFVVWEQQYNYNWYRSNFKYHVVGGVDVDPTNIPLLRPVKGSLTIDANQLGKIQEWDDLGVTVFAYRPSTKEVFASWDVGEVSLGDLNGDLNIDKKDGALYKNQIGKTVNDPDFNPAADWDGDGDCDSDDTALFRNYIKNGGLR